MNEWEQWCFDSGVEYFGSEAQAAMDAVEAKNERLRAGKRENVLRQFLGMEQKFRPLAGMPAGSAERDRVKPPFAME